MNEQACNLLLNMLSDMGKRLSEAHSKIAAMEITSLQYQPEISAAYGETLKQIRDTHPPVSFSSEELADLRKALLRR